MRLVGVGAQAALLVRLVGLVVSLEPDDLGLPFEGDSQVVWFEGNYQDYEADRKRRLGSAADQPHRIKYLEAIFDYVKRFDGVLHWNGAQILDWYKSAANVQFKNR